MARSAKTPRGKTQRGLSRRGNYAIIVALMATVLLGFGAFVVDYGYLRMVSFQAQNAADAGAHAALVELREGGSESEARLVAEEIIGLNYVGGQVGQVDSSDLVFGYYDFEDRTFDSDGEYINAVYATVRRTSDSPGGPVDLFLAKVFGEESGSAGSSGRALGALRSREIMVVQDVTSSFADEMGHIADDVETWDNWAGVDYQDTWPDDAEHLFGDPQAAALAFLDYLDALQLPGDKIGMVTFVGAAELHTDLQLIRDNYDSVRAQWLDLDWCDRSYYPWNCYQFNASGGSASWSCDIRKPKPLYRAMHTSNMIACNSGVEPSFSDSGTSQGAGLEEAIDVLTDPGLTSQYALKTIVLISDGLAQCVPSEAACDASVSEYGLVMADFADANGISIFTVSFNETENADQTAYMESLVRGYGQAFETPDPSELPEILETIASAIPIALVQ
jgi:hypothetical protein